MAIYKAVSWRREGNRLVREQVQTIALPDAQIFYAGGGGGENTPPVPTGPWSQQAPYVRQLFEQANQLYSTGGPQQYQGDLVVGQPGSLTTSNQAVQGFVNNQAQPMGAAQQQAFGASQLAPLAPQYQQGVGGLLNAQNNALAQYGTGMLPQVGGAVTTAANAAGTQANFNAPGTGTGSLDAGGAINQMLAGGPSPYLDEILNAGTRHLTRQHNDVMSGIRDDFGINGYDNSRLATAEGIEGQGYLDSVQDTIFPILNEELARSRAHQATGAQLVTQAQQSDADRALQAQGMGEQSFQGRLGTGLTAAQQAQAAAASGLGLGYNATAQGAGAVGQDASLGLQGAQVGSQLGQDYLGMLGANQDIGLQDLAYQQQVRDAQVQQWNYQQMLPYMALTQFQNFIGGPWGSSIDRSQAGGGPSQWWNGSGSGSDWYDTIWNNWNNRVTQQV